MGVTRDNYNYGARQDMTHHTINAFEFRIVRFKFDSQSCSGADDNLRHGPCTWPKTENNWRISLQELRKMGDFNPWRTPLEPHFIITESLVAPCAVVFAWIASEQTNKQTNWIIIVFCHCKWWRSCHYLQSLKSSLMSFRRLSIERNVFMS